MRKFVVAGWVLAALPLFAQGIGGRARDVPASAAANAGPAPRLPDGHPDLGNGKGVWNPRTITNLSGNGPQGYLCQSRLHATHRGHGPRRIGSPAETSLCAGVDPGISVPLPLARQFHRLLGQPLFSALCGVGLFPRRAPHGTRDHHRRPAVLKNFCTQRRRAAEKKDCSRGGAEPRRWAGAV